MQALILEDAEVSSTTFDISQFHRRLGQGTPGWVDFVLMFGLGFLLYRLLMILKGISDKRKNKMKARIKQAIEERKLYKDPFRSQNGYSWDMVMVFPVRKESVRTSEIQNKHSLKFVLDRLAQGGLETKSFYSVQNDEIYVKIRAPLMRLMREADRIDFKLPLNELQVGSYMMDGKPGKWKGVEIPANCAETDIPPYAYVFAPYEFDAEGGSTREDLANLYLVHGNGSIFRGVDRLKLLQSIIAARGFEGGCHLAVHQLIHDGCLLGCSPIHDIVELRALEEGWLRFIQLPWRQRVDLVKDYFGEKIGLYFLFLGHYTTWLISASVVGFLAYIIMASNDNNPNSLFMPYFAVFMSLWSTLFLEYWKKKEKLYAVKWGMVGFEEEEQDRPQFQGQLIPSPVSGKPFLYFPRNEFAQRISISVGVVTVCIGVVIGAVTGIFILRIILSNMRSLIVGGTQIGGIVASLVNAVQIQILNMVYQGIALKLTNFENHRTDTEFEDSLIAKTFLFQFVNSFASLFYIAFIKPFIPTLDPCVSNSCMIELQTALGTIFMTRLAVGTLVEIALPWYNNRSREAENAKGIPKGKKMSEVEKGFLMEEYHVMLGSFQDFSNITIQFGYFSMFVVAFPLANCIAFLCNYIEMRIGAWKLCQLCRRPEPRSAEDIGTWYTILEIVGFCSAVVNAGIIAFTSEIAFNDSWTQRVWIFFGIALLLVLVKYLIQLVVDDVPEDVQIQLDRHEYILDKVLHDIPDECDSPLKTFVPNKDIEYVIRMTDDDPL